MAWRNLGRRLFRNADRRAWAGRWIALLVLCGMLCLTLAGLRAKARPLALPVFRGLAESAVQSLVQTVADELTQKEEYRSICTFTYAEDGKIAGLWVDSFAANRMVAELTRRLQEGLSRIALSCKVHSGDVILPEFCSGSGIPFTVRGSLYGGATARLVSDLVEGGLNQTLHRLEIEVSVPLTMTVLGETVEFGVTSRILLGEAVIVGTMPGGVVVGG